MEAASRDIGSLASLAGLAGFLVLVVLVASTGAMFRPGEWYEALAKPGWTPPNWLFPVAWTALYVMIAAAGWLAWLERGLTAAPLAFALYFGQLALNAAWSWLFFGLRRMDLAFVDVSLLWLLIVGTILAFHAIRPLAAWLLLPYWVWVSYAAALNFTVWRMNS